MSNKNETILKQLSSKFYTEISSLKKEDIEDKLSDYKEYFSSEHFTFNKKNSTEKHITICPTETMSFDKDGSPLSRYCENSWFLLNKDGNKLGFYFAADLSKRSIDYRDPLTTPLKLVEKLIMYRNWPYKNATAKPMSANTVQRYQDEVRHLIDWFYTNGYFLSVSTEDVDNICTADAVNSHIDDLIESADSATPVRTFVYAIQKWFDLASTNLCPPWFVPKFSFSDIINAHSVVKISNYLSNNISQWEAIEFDDLLALTDVSKTYLEEYSEDLFFIYDLLLENKELIKGKSIGGRSNPKSHILKNELLKHEFAKSSETGREWFKPIITDSDTIEKSSLTEQFRILAGAAIFILITFTGSRRNELLNTKISALDVDGSPIDTSFDPIAQVKAGTHFDFTRPLYKSDKHGRPHKVPVPRMAALAFAIILRVYSFQREDIGSDYIIPGGGLSLPGLKQYKTGERKSATSFTLVLQTFCSAAGVDYQHPHKCRKTLATILINHDPKSIHVIKLLLGHESIEMTYEYLMSLPTINEDLLLHLEESNIKVLTHFMADALDGKVAGPQGNHTLDTLLENLEAWKGNRAPLTMNSLLQSFKDSNFIIHRTPAAWCIRFPTRAPKDAPCLPRAIRSAIKEGTFVDSTETHPRLEHCVPWECGHVGHTTSNMEMAERNLKHASKKASGGPSAQAQQLANYKEQERYWAEVVEQLKYGRPDFRTLLLADMLLAGADQ